MKKKLGCGLIVAMMVLGLGACSGSGKTTYAVELTERGDTPIKLIKTVMEITGLGLKEAKEIADNVPSIVVEGLSEEEAKAVVEQLEAAGGTAVIK